MPKEETFPIPLKYIDVTRTTNTNLDVLQESRIDDYWNVDVNRKFVRVMDRIHEVRIIEKKKPPHVVQEAAFRDSSNSQT